MAADCGRSAGVPAVRRHRAHAERPRHPPVSAPQGTGQTATAAEDGFDHLIHAPVRLRICAALDPVREVEFGALLTLLDLSKSALSKHVSVLAEAGYVTQR